MRTRTALAAALALLAIFALVIAGTVVASRQPGLPADALAALSRSVGAARGTAGLRVLEVERIGPDFAVIYALSGSPGAALLISSADDWSVEGAPDPLGLLIPAPHKTGSASLVADDLQVVFLAVPDRRVRRVAVRFPADGVVLTAERRRTYVIVWRPAAGQALSYLVESFDGAGRRLSP